MRTRALIVALAVGLAGCGGDGGGDDAPKTEERPAVTKNEADVNLLRGAIAKYRRDTTQLIAAVRSGLVQGDYDDDLNMAVYDLRVAIYRFDQVLRRIDFDRSALDDVDAILTNDAVAISRLDPIIDAKRWPKDTEATVKRVLSDIEKSKPRVDALLARL